MSKGIELPVNVLVIVAIAVIVLIGLIVLLGKGISETNPIFVELEKANACGKLKNVYSCNSAQTASVAVDSGSVGKDVTNLQQLCNKFRSCDKSSDAADCCAVNVCGCAGTPATFTTTTRT